MASRSFKPASYLASAAHAQRPPFARTSSNSSTRSEDSIASTFKGLSTSENFKENIPVASSSSTASSVSPGHHHASLISKSYFEEHKHTITPSDTSGRKNSAPIAIELPGRNPHAVYTPLSARGDLPGGYFPNHQDGEVTRSYKSHPFHNHHDNKTFASPETPFIMSAVGTPTHESTPRSHGMLSPGFPADALSIPMGKYHPSNYISPANSSVTSPGLSSVPPPFPSTNLTIPKTVGKRPAPPRSIHERRGSDVKRKVQQYQRDMIAQARMRSSENVPKVIMKPESPKLTPLGSPGPITPFELEEGGGYLVAGSKTSMGRRSGEMDRQRDLVQRMIDTEELRAQSPRAMA